MVEPLNHQLIFSVVPDWWPIAQGCCGLIDYTINQKDVTCIIDVTTVPNLEYVPRILPYTCVSVVKSVLGLRCRAFTPYQLFKYLSEKHDGR